MSYVLSNFYEKYIIRSKLLSNPVTPTPMNTGRSSPNNPTRSWRVCLTGCIIMPHYFTLGFSNAPMQFYDSTGSTQLWTNDPKFLLAVRYTQMFPPSDAVKTRAMQSVASPLNLTFVNLDLWSMTLKINLNHSLLIGDFWAEFEENILDYVFLLCTIAYCYFQITYCKP